MLNAIADKLLTLIAPQECAVCGSEVMRRADGVACDGCWNSTRLFGPDDTLCTKCGTPSDGYSEHEYYCRQCDDQAFDSAIACGVYDKALAATVIRLKNVPVIPQRVARLVIPALDALPAAAFDLIVPVPLSASRRVERGFNQAEVIADLIWRKTSVPVDRATLVRKGHTIIHRAGMDRKAREASVKNAFEVVRPKLIKGKQILLVDDVHTSGATVSNCAKALKKSGAAAVNVFTLARAVIVK